MKAAMHMGMTVYSTNLIFSDQQARQAIDTARRWDVAAGGLYDAEASAISIWSNPQLTPEMCRESELEGTIHIEWDGSNHMAAIRALEISDGWSRGDLERHIPLLFGRPLREAGRRG